MVRSIKESLRRLPLVGAMALVAACNVFAPLEPDSSVQDHVQIGQKCEAALDFACARAEYDALPDGPLKSRKLCTLSLSVAGVTLSTLVNTVTIQGAAMLGATARELMPWSEAKDQAAKDASSVYCAAYASDPQSGDDGPLLLALSQLVHCSTLIAKVDQWVAVSDDDVACNTPGRRAGTVIAGDISDDPATVNGTPKGDILQRGMCAADVLSCRKDVFSILRNDKFAARFGDIKRAVDAMPDGLKDENLPVDGVRGAIKQTFSAN